MKSLQQLCLLIVCGCFMLMGVGCGDSRQPSGKYVSVIRLLVSGEEWTETIEFKRNGICYYSHPPTVAECKWSRHGNTITISRNGVVLNELLYDGNSLLILRRRTFADRMFGRSELKSCVARRLTQTPYS